MDEYKFNESQCPSKCPKCESANISNYKNDQYELACEDKLYHCDGCGFSWSELWVFQSWSPLFDESS